MNSPEYFEIQADNLSRAKKFYEGIFGWKFAFQDGLPIEYYHIETTGITGGLLPRPVPAPSGGTNAYVISMKVNNFDEIAKKIISAGGQVALPKFAIPGKCWQGYFLDTESNTFGIFQPDDKAV
ncbi:VOC family protein [Candidatus Saccharibacteria bacterium]|nr:VOC family protein [Candidatus Saccharibacteria bacterium]